jgi:hypothetical protein
MAKGKFGIVGAFTLGFGLGMTSSKWWPVIKEKAGPLGKELLAKGMDAADKAKDLFWEKSEKFADVIAEIKEDQEDETKDKKKGLGKKKSPLAPVDNT